MRKDIIKAYKNKRNNYYDHEDAKIKLAKASIELEKTLSKEQTKLLKNLLDEFDKYSDSLLMDFLRFLSE